ncbi:MAG: bifunctional diguanylate cyclase/phosphodiesterase [Acidimicrobiales bacterium]
MNASAGSETERAGRLSRLMGRSQPDKPAPAPAVDGALDPISGLPTRVHLQDWANEARERSRPGSLRSAVVFVNIGRIDDVNDSYGPDAGDHVLREVAGRLTRIDLPGTKVAHYTGTEFVLVFEKLSNISMVEEICAFLLELLTPAYQLGKDELDVQISVGAAIWGDAYESVDEQIRDAHEALVKVRGEGSKAWHVHDEVRRARHTTRIDEERLRNALDDDEFCLFYQPIVRTDTDEMIGVEALIRWRAPGATNVGLLFPHDFMPLLEKTGLSVPVGNWVIRESCRQASAWASAFPDARPLFITCNIAPRQLAHPSFTDEVTRAVELSDIQPWQLCLDITEATLRYNRSATWASLRGVKDLGVKIGLDDFGTGISSFAFLRELKLDLVRVDRGFVAGVTVSDTDRTICKNIVRLAHDLELIAVAEGVESRDQADELYTMGVDLAQGFLYGRPESPEQIADRLRGGERPDDGTWDPSQVLDYPEGGGSS